MLQLDIFHNETFIERKVLDQHIIKVGSLKSASHIYLEDPKVARLHAVIESDGQDYRIIDLGSHQGSILNGERVSRNALIKENDLLTFGDFKIRILRSGEFQTDVEPERDSKTSTMVIIPTSPKTSISHVPSRLALVSQTEHFCQSCGVRYQSQLPAFCMGEFRKLSLWEKIKVLFFRQI